MQEARKKLETYPAPSVLSTETDLTQDEAKAVTEAVNPLVADAFALYVKTKNFHWHLFGPHFRDYHLLFDEQAEQILESVDIMAERVRRIGGTTIRSISHISDLTQIEDDNEEAVPAQEMMMRLIQDNGKIAKSIRKAIEVCEENRDTPTSNMLQDILDQTEKRKWFLFEITQHERER